MLRVTDDTLFVKAGLIDPSKAEEIEQEFTTALDTHEVKFIVIDVGRQENGFNASAFSFLGLITRLYPVISKSAHLQKLTVCPIASPPGYLSYFVTPLIQMFPITFSEEIPANGNVHQRD